MRNLTIKRNKSFVGCLVRDKVYIRDYNNPEITISGVPCRFLGTLKNGAQVSFQIPDEEQQIFVIADKLSKETCNATVTLPAGQDYFLTGKHHFVLGSNPFRFDGVDGPGLRENQKKQGRKGAAIWIIAVIIGLIVGFAITNIGPAPKTFKKGDHFAITLNKDFEKITDVKEYEDYYAVYGNKYATVMVLREEFDDYEGLEDLTLDEYIELSLEANGHTGTAVKKGDGYKYITYSEIEDGEFIHYTAAFYKGHDGFFAISFATPSENADEYREDFAKWAASVDVD